jgi:hypothetical protein
MAYKVINTFLEKNHENLVYNKGDVYPSEGFEADPKRVTFLRSKRNKYKIAFLGEEIKEEKVEDKPAEEVSKDEKVEDTSQSKENASKEEVKKEVVTENKETTNEEELAK